MTTKILLDLITKLEKISDDFITNARFVISEFTSIVDSIKSCIKPSLRSVDEFIDDLQKAAMDDKNESFHAKQAK